MKAAADYTSNAAERRASRAEKEFQDFFESSLGPVTSIIGLVVGYLLLKDLEFGAELALLPDEVEALAPPLSRILAKQNLSAKVRKAIVTSGDYSAIAGVMVLYVSRIYEAIKERQVNELNGNTTQPLEEDNADSRPVASNGHDARAEQLIISGAYQSELASY